MFREKDQSGVVTFISEDKTVGIIKKDGTSYYFHQAGIATPVGLGDDVKFDAVFL